MSDYLELLISRSFAALDVIRPRSVSRFERRSPGLPVGIAASPDPGMAEPRRQVTTVTAPREVSPPSRHDDALRVRPQTTEPPAPLVTTVTPPPVSPLASDAGVRPAPAPRQERIGAAPVAAPPMRHAVIQPTRHDVIVERPAGRPPSLEPRPQAPSQPSLATPTLAVLPAGGRPHPVPESPPRPIESATAIEPRFAAREHRPSTPSSEPPAIHVTIGRIEIRATSAAAPVREQHRQPSVMSLDEYLKQRAGGGPR